MKTAFKITSSLALALAATSLAFAQAPAPAPNGPPEGAPPAAAPAASGTPPAPPGQPRPYKDVLKDSKAIPGYFTLHRKEEKVWIEIKPEQFDKPFFFSSRQRAT